MYNSGASSSLNVLFFNVPVAVFLNVFCSNRQFSAASGLLFRSGLADLLDSLVSVCHNEKRTFVRCIPRHALQSYADVSRNIGCAPLFWTYFRVLCRLLCGYRGDVIDFDLTQLNGPAWRDAAMHYALRIEAEDGEGMDALLYVARQKYTQGATLLLWHDRLRLRQFLQTRAEGFTSLLPGNDGHIERGETCPYVAWYEVTWEGTRIEIALPPGTYVSTGSLLMADDAVVLRRFADALEDFALRPAGRSLRYSQGWESAPDLDAEMGKVTWDDVVLAPKIMSGVREAVEGFFQHKDAFEALGFPWRRGLLLVGPPGTGKTMICKAAASALPDLPFLYVRDFSSGSHTDAVEAIFERARKLAPCLLAFEDIDGLVTQGNRTVFLNELDGFQNNDGLLIIASSNHPGKIDEALLKRPSRFDRVFHIGLPAISERREYCERLLSRSSLAARLSPDLSIPVLAQTVAEWSEGFTPAYLKEVFVSAALRRAQSGAMVLDEQFHNAVVDQVEELRKHLKRMQKPDELGEFSSPESAPMGIRGKTSRD